MPLADYQTLIDSLVRDDGGAITAANRDQAIALAVVRYSTDRPRSRVEAVISPGGAFLDLPSGWEADFSRLAAVQIPDAGLGKAGAIGAALEQGLSGWRIRLDRTFLPRARRRIFILPSRIALRKSETPFPSRSRGGFQLEQKPPAARTTGQPLFRSPSTDNPGGFRGLAMAATSPCGQNAFAKATSITWH